MGPQCSGLVGQTPATGSPVHPGARHRRAGVALCAGGVQQRFHGVGLCRELFAAPASEGFT